MYADVADEYEWISAHCLDSTTWSKANSPNKGCDWVASMKTKRRCTKRGDDGTRAHVGCPVACGRCPGDDDGGATEE